MKTPSFFSKFNTVLCCIVLYCIVRNVAYSQNPCGTIPTPHELQFMDRQLSFVNATVLQKTIPPPPATINIPLKINMVENSDGTNEGSFSVNGSDSDLSADIDFLNNTYFQGSNIQFELCEINHIKNDNYYTDFDISSVMDEVINFHEGKNMLNVYLTANNKYNNAWGIYPPGPNRAFIRYSDDTDLGDYAPILAHELGHVLGLIHTFGEETRFLSKELVIRLNTPGKVFPIPNCTTTADRLCGTEADPGYYDTFSCANCYYTEDKGCGTPGTPNYCGTNTIHKDVNNDCYLLQETQTNLMSYNSLNCIQSFTDDQKSRMYAFASLMTNLVSPCNKPVADFRADRQWGCGSLSVNFTDVSRGNIISWLWDFGDGFSSAVQSPTHIYNSQGNYSVSLTINDGSETVTKIKTDFILVNGTAVPLPYLEDFETGTFSSIDWIVENNNNDVVTWELIDQEQENDLYLCTGDNVKIIGADGVQTKAARVLMSYNNSVDALISPAYDFSGTTGNTLFFDLAYQKLQTSGATDDILKVYYTTDCGTNWIEIFNKSGCTLATVDECTKPCKMIPQNACQWRNEAIDLSTINAVSVRFKFEFTSGENNNILIDNIIIDNVTTQKIVCAYVTTDLDACGGNAVVTVKGGTAPYAYSWSNGSTTEDQQGLSAGTYVVNVTDNNGYTASASFNIDKTEIVYDYPNGYTVRNNETWNSGSTIRIKGILKVNPGVTLTISNSTIVEFEPASAAHKPLRFACREKIRLPENTSAIEVDDNENIEFFCNGSSGILLDPELTSGIVIEPAGVLNVYDAVLRGTCNRKWGGIHVKGQFFTGNDPNNFLSAKQGHLNIGANSVIEYPYIISLYPHNIISNSTYSRYYDFRYNFRQGLITAVGATFKLNWGTIVFGSERQQPNESRFEKCIFSTTEKARFLSLVEVTGVTIKGCEFRNDNPNLLTGEIGYGIMGYNATFKVLNDDEGTPNSFHNLTNGIIANGYSPAPFLHPSTYQRVIASAEIINCTFDNVQRGIGLGSTTSDRIIGNIFQNIPSASPGFDTYGFRAASADKFEISGNSFSGSPSANPSVNASYGIAIENSGQEGGTIFNNQFSGTDYGIQTQDDNQNLNVRCNRFASDDTPHNAYAWYTADGTLKQQGVNCNEDFNPAGNEWGNGTAVLCIQNAGEELDIKVDNNVDFKYYAHNHLSSNLIESTQPHCSTVDWKNNLTVCDVLTGGYEKLSTSCDNPTPGIVPPGGGSSFDVDKWVGDIQKLRDYHCEQINTLKKSIIDLRISIDGGNTKALIDFISKMPPAPVTQLYDRLHASLPLSDNALLAVIKRKEKIPPGLLTEVLKKNSPLEKNVWEEVKKMRPALPLKNMQDLELAQKQVPLFPREKDLEKRVLYHKGEQQLLKNKLVDELIRNYRKDQAEEIIWEDKCGESKKEKVSLHLSRNEFAEARATLNQISTESITDTAFFRDTTAKINLKNNEQYCKLMNCLINVQESGRTIYELQDNETVLIREVAGTKTQTSVYAEVILEQTQGEHFEHPIKKPSRDAFVNARKGEDEPTSEFQNNSHVTFQEEKYFITIIPNPLNGNGTLICNLPEADFQYVFYVYDLYGRKVKSLNVNSGKTINVIETKNLDAGIYFYRIGHLNSSQFKGKVLITK